MEGGVQVRPLKGQYCSKGINVLFNEKPIKQLNTSEIGSADRGSPEGKIITGGGEKNFR